MTKTCSQESQPPQRNNSIKDIVNKEEAKLGVEIQSVPESEPIISELDTQVKGEIPAISALDSLVKEEYPKTVEANATDIGDLDNLNLRPFPAEDFELAALREHIFSKSFTPAGVAFHIVALCSQPLVTTSTTTWDFKDRASIPDMVHTLLRQPGYLEGIYPSLKVVMSDNVGNATWSAGICTTIAFFDTIRVLPTLREMENE